MRRRRVPNVMSSSSARTRISDYNLRNDSMKDIKQFHGWSEQRLEQGVREGARDASSKDIGARYKEAYSQEKNK